MGRGKKPLSCSFVRTQQIKKLVSPSAGEIKELVCSWNLENNHGQDYFPRLKSGKEKTEHGEYGGKD